MSNDVSPPDRFWPLVEAACLGMISQEECLELQTILRGNSAVQRLYLEYCRMHSELRLACGVERSNEAVLPKIAASEVPSMATLVNIVPEAGVSWCTGWPLAYLVATVIVGVGIAVAAMVHTPQPMQIVHQPASLPASLSPLPSVVGRITGMVDCVWEKEGLGDRDWGLDKAAMRRGQETGNKNQKSQIINHKSLVALGDRFALRSGLLEITYDTGAKVILQGPVTYQVDSVAGGYLAIGKLTARLEKKAETQNLPSLAGTDLKGWSGRGAGGEGSSQRDTDSDHNQPQSALTLALSRKRARGPDSPLFTISTPTAIVTDLGTEFGVEVMGDGNTVSHVFRGVVKVQALDTRGVATGSPSQLTANKSAQVCSPGKLQMISIAAPAASKRFVREIARKSSTPFEIIAWWQFDGDKFLADSSGHGHTLVNRGATQVDGTASFDGKAILSSVDSLNLTLYKRVRVSWSQKATSPGEDQVIWEHGHDYNFTSGAIIAYLGGGHGTAGIRVLDRPEGYNLDDFPVTGDLWEHFVVEYDRTAYRAYVVKVFKDGLLIGEDTNQEALAPDSFINAPFHVGARGQADGKGAHFFRGQIDNVKIEGIRQPDPSTAKDKSDRR